VLAARAAPGTWTLPPTPPTLAKSSPPVSSPRPDLQRSPAQRRAPAWARLSWWTACPWTSARRAGGGRCSRRWARTSGTPSSTGRAGWRRRARCGRGCSTAAASRGSGGARPLPPPLLTPAPAPAGPCWPLLAPAGPCRRRRHAPARRCTGAPHVQGRGVGGGACRAQQGPQAVQPLCRPATEPLAARPPAPCSSQGGVEAPAGRVPAGQQLGGARGGHAAARRALPAAAAAVAEHQPGAGRQELQVARAQGPGGQGRAQDRQVPRRCCPCCCCRRRGAAAAAAAAAGAAAPARLQAGRGVPSGLLERVSALRRC
jgi:hypothetical protein